MDELTAPIGATGIPVWVAVVVVLVVLVLIALAAGRRGRKQAVIKTRQG